VPLYAPKEQQEKVINAVNTIVDHAKRRLRDGCRIQIDIDVDRATVALFDTDGREYEVVPPSVVISYIDEACVMSMSEVPSA